MKNIFKLMGIALIATSMIACGDKNKENEEDNTPTIANGINVTFKSNTWTAATNDCGYFANYGAMQFSAAKTTSNEFPIFDEVIYTEEVGAITENATNGMFGQNDAHNYVEYYEETYLSDGQYTYGDWWAETATTDIKAIDLTAMTVTAVLNGKMFSAAEAFVPAEGQETAPGLTPSTSRTDYKATFGNVSLDAK